MKKIIVLGSGLVGGTIAKDLAENHDVTSVDISSKNLEKINSSKINKICTDILEENVLVQTEDIASAINELLEY